MVFFYSSQAPGRLLLFPDFNSFAYRFARWRRRHCTPRVTSPPSPLAAAADHVTVCVGRFFFISRAEVRGHVILRHLRSRDLPARPPPICFPLPPHRDGGGRFFHVFKFNPANPFFIIGKRVKKIIKRGGLNFIIEKKKLNIKMESSIFSKNFKNSKFD